MTRSEFENLQLNSLVILITSGVETCVVAIDESDDSFMDHCAVWHHYSDADAPTYEY